MYSYFEFRGYDKEICLSNWGYAEIVTFLTWLLDNRKMKRQSSVKTMWDYLHAEITKRCGTLDKSISIRVNQFVTGLKLSGGKPKPVFNVMDFQNLIKFNWSFASYRHERDRVQNALLIQV